MYKIKALLFRIKLKWQMIRGYIDKDLAPKKCPYCKHKQFEKAVWFTEDIWGSQQEVEFILNCKNCGKQVGHYAYGSWFL